MSTTINTLDAEQDSKYKYLLGADFQVGERVFFVDPHSLLIEVTKVAAITFKVIDVQAKVPVPDQVNIVTSYMCQSKPDAQHKERASCNLFATMEKAVERVTYYNK